MTEPIYQEALNAFITPRPGVTTELSFHQFDVEPVPGGLINQSFKIISRATSESFLLQRINELVFPDPEKVQQNYELLWDYLTGEKINFHIPALKYFPDNKSFFYDSNGSCWRVFEFIKNTKTLNIPTTAALAGRVAEAFANFTLSLSDFDPEELEIVIPEFHNLSLRFNQFKHSILTGNIDRIQKASSLIEALKIREHYTNLYDVITGSDDFLLRVMHHDAKISNVLFNNENEYVACLVDLDTAMPGYYFSDLGDMIRSMAASAEENSTDFRNIKIRKAYYEAIVESYLGVLKDQLTETEKKYIHHAGILMVYMQALRFFTDYLNGDVYYSINYPGQNYDRAKNQITLLQQLENFLETNYNVSLA